MPAGRGFIVINSNRYKFIQNQEKTQKTTKKSGHPLDFFITGVTKGDFAGLTRVCRFEIASAKRDKSRLSGLCKPHLFAVADAYWNGSVYPVCVLDFQIFCRSQDGKIVGREVLSVPCDDAVGFCL